MQSIRKDTLKNIRHTAADFDFGEAQRGTSRPRKQRPGLAAGVIAFAFAVSMFLPVGARAEAEPAWKRHPDQLSEPTRPTTDLGIWLADSKRSDRPGWDRPHRKALPSVCAVQIDGRRSGFNGYSENCLRREGVRERLPRGCASNARIFGQRDRLYPAECLRDAGFALRDR